MRSFLLADPAADPSADGVVATLLHRRAPTPHVDDRARLDAGALEAALDAGEVTAWMRPTLRIADGALVGIDAVPLWSHRRHGLLDADAFAALARRAGLGGRLVERMTRIAADFVQAHRGPGAVPVSVVLTAADLADHALVERLGGIVEAAGVAPSAVAFALSEHRLVEEEIDAVGLLNRLRMRGFGLVVDDFGAGCASLAMLAQVPAGEMRIDARFVVAAPTDEVARGIVESSVQIARRLRMRVVAKGVEAPAQLAMCERLGIDAGQGTALGRPLPPEAFAERYLPA